VGKAKGSGCAQESGPCPEENRWPEADECGDAKKIVGVDEGTVGG
jgi:hypothetical protein